MKMKILQGTCMHISKTQNTNKTKQINLIQQNKNITSDTILTLLLPKSP